MLSNSYMSINNRTWHVGEKAPLSYHEVQFVGEIQAHGDELYHLMSKFDTPDSTGLFSNLRVQRWFEDEAKRLVSMLI
jgi:hypothetical protein